MELNKYLINLEKFGIKMGLDNIIGAAKLFDNPQNKFKSIHIAGTNGKGSTAKILSEIISKKYSVGLYISPHLIKVNERIQINNSKISDLELLKYIKKIKDKLEINNISLTYFEFLTLLAFVYFADKKVDYAVIEVGLGGRFDATNIVCPELCIITNIAFDHEKYLGDTLEKIAFEKAGIIKSKTVTSETNSLILNIFKEKKFQIINDLCKVSSIKQTLEIQTILVRCKKLGLNNIIKTNFMGVHQIQNISLALTALRELNLSINKQDIILSLENCVWAGRLQKVFGNVFVDGAHNENSICVLVDFIKKINTRDLLVIGISEDKNKELMLSKICPLFKRVIFTQSSFKPILAKNLAKYGVNYCKSFEIASDLKKTVPLLKQSKDFSLVTGSLYLVGDFLKLIKNN
jgi:dihydrofolate synthase / folylpolyglutamate synthase